MKIEEDNKVVEKIESKPKSDFIRHEPLEICFCDRAPGFSRNPKPPPHYKTSYCLSVPYSPPRDKIIGRSKSQHSYFTDVKINRSIDESQKLIIEEIPNDDNNENDSKSLREPDEARETVAIGDCVENDNERDKKKQKIAKKESKMEKEDPIKSSPGFSPQKKIDVAKKYEKASPKVVPENKIEVPKVCA